MDDDDEWESVRDGGGARGDARVWNVCDETRRRERGRTRRWKAKRDDDDDDDEDDDGRSGGSGGKARDGWTRVEDGDRGFLERERIGVWTRGRKRR